MTTGTPATVAKRLVGWAGPSVRCGLEVCAAFFPSDVLTCWHLGGTGSCPSRGLLLIALEIVPQAVTNQPARRRADQSPGRASRDEVAGQTTRDGARSRSDGLVLRHSADPAGSTGRGIAGCQRHQTHQRDTYNWQSRHSNLHFEMHGAVWMVCSTIANRYERLHV